MAIEIRSTRSLLLPLPIPTEEDMSDLGKMNIWYRNLIRAIQELTERTYYDINNLNQVPDNLPTYADNTAAVAGGLLVGELYKTSAGVVMVVYA